MIGLLLLPLAVHAENICLPGNPLPECREIHYLDLPREARALLRQNGCSVAEKAPYDFGLAMSLEGKGSSEYLFCCDTAPHGPCPAFLLGKRDGKWQLLSESVSGFTECGAYSVTKGQSPPYPDLCVPGSARLHFEQGKYRKAP